MKPHKTWDVLPHGPIQQLAENLYLVEGRLKMPLGETTRHMTIVRLTEDRLAIFSAIALDEPRMRELEALGRPAYLIVPSGIHRLDAKPWKDRYPEIEVVAPAGSLPRIGQIVPIDATAIDLLDPRVQVITVPGTDRRELAMVVETGTGKTLVLNDLIFNLPKIPGLAGLGLRMLGFGPGHPSMPKLVMKKLVTDREAVRAQLRAWAESGFERIIVSHGAPIETPRETLRELSAA